MSAARFDQYNHAWRPGWATYQRRPMFRWRLRCAFHRHKLPPQPDECNGHSPSNYDRCPRCRAFLKWFVNGQHRYGGMHRDVELAYWERGGEGVKDAHGDGTT